MNSGGQKDCILSIPNGAKDYISDFSLEGNEIKSNEYEFWEKDCATVLNEHDIEVSDESVTSVSKVSDYICKEMSNVSSSDIERYSNDVDRFSNQFEVDKNHEDLDFMEEDGIIYMFVLGSSMTCQYILKEEDEDEDWFPKMKVYEEVGKFINSQPQILGVKNCAQQRLDLNIILEGLRKGMVDKVINDEFLNFTFMKLYKTIEGYV